MAHDGVVLAKSSEETRRRLIADWGAVRFHTCARLQGVSEFLAIKDR
jgi:hypothetical protein